MSLVAHNECQCRIRTAQSVRYLMRCCRFAGTQGLALLIQHRGQFRVSAGDLQGDIEHGQGGEHSLPRCRPADAPALRHRAMDADQQLRCGDDADGCVAVVLPGEKSNGTTTLRSMRIKTPVSMSNPIGCFLPGARLDA